MDPMRFNRFLLAFATLTVYSPVYAPGLLVLASVVGGGVAGGIFVLSSGLWLSRQIGQIEADGYLADASARPWPWWLRMAVVAPMYEWVSTDSGDKR